MIDMVENSGRQASWAEGKIQSTLQKVKEAKLEVRKTFKIAKMALRKVEEISVECLSHKILRPSLIGKASDKG